MYKTFFAQKMVETKINLQFLQLLVSKIRKGKYGFLYYNGINQTKGDYIMSNKAKPLLKIL